LLPLLAAPDPRHAFALATARTREHELAKLEATVPLSGAIELFAENYLEMRRVIRRIPASVAKALADGPNDQVTVEKLIQNHVHAALHKLSNTAPATRGPISARVQE
jgi:hypothetical protein